MNPIILKLGLGVVVAVVACVVAFREYKRQQGQYQPPLSRFDGSDVTTCGICLDGLSDVNGSGLVSLPCKHKFHRCCIITVFSAKTQVSNCPLCRRRVDSAFVASVLQGTNF